MREITKAVDILKRRYLTTPERIASFEAELAADGNQSVGKLKYPVVMIYAVDWNQYSGQHKPSDGEPYCAAKGWVVGFLIEETDEHLVIAHTYFDMGDVRYALVILKRTIIQRNGFELKDGA